MKFELDHDIDWAALTDVVELDLEQLLHWRSLEPLLGLAHLRRLRIGRAESIRDWSPLANLTLDELRLVDHWENLADIGFLQGLDLEVLDLSGSHQLRALGPLRKQRRLHTLDLSDCWALRDLRPVADLPALRELRLFRCKLLADLRPLASTTVQTLVLEACPAVWDLRPLAEHPHLRSLDLRGCDVAPDTLGPMALTELTVGDVPLDRLACPDLQVLAYSAASIDLAPLVPQQALHTLVLSGAIVDPGVLLELPALRDLRWIGGPLPEAVHAELAQRGVKLLVL